MTNQWEIGRAYYTQEAFRVLANWMCFEFERQGASIDKGYFSPYHPTAGLGLYLQDEDTRKPRPGMILKAQKEFNLSLQRSIIAGDKPSDIQAGVAAGVGAMFLSQLSMLSC